MKSIDLPKNLQPRLRVGGSTPVSSAAGQLLLTSSVTDPVDTAEKARLNLGLEADRVRRSALGQFFSPAATARLMASMSSLSRDRVSLLDAGAGVGALTAAWVTDLCDQFAQKKLR